MSSINQSNNNKSGRQRVDRTIRRHEFTKLSLSSTQIQMVNALDEQKDGSDDGREPGKVHFSCERGVLGSTEDGLGDAFREISTTGSDSQRLESTRPHSKRRIGRIAARDGQTSTAAGSRMSGVLTA